MLTLKGLIKMSKYPISACVTTIYGFSALFSISESLSVLRKHLGKQKLSFPQIRETQYAASFFTACAMITLALAPVHWYRTSYLPYTQGRPLGAWAQIETVLALAASIFMLRLHTSLGDRRR